MMTDNQPRQGPGKGAFDIIQRIGGLLITAVETRVRLITLELEEEKANFIQLLIMAGLTLLFAAFGLMTLLVLLCWAIDPEYRLKALAITTVVLFALSIIGAIWTVHKARNAKFMHETRNQLRIDRDHLEKKGE